MEAALLMGRQTHTQRQRHQEFPRFLLAVLPPLPCEAWTPLLPALQLHDTSLFAKDKPLLFKLARGHLLLKMNSPSPLLGASNSRVPLQTLATHVLFLRAGRKNL